MARAFKTLSTRESKNRNFCLSEKCKGIALYLVLLMSIVGTSNTTFGQTDETNNEWVEVESPRLISENYKIRREKIGWLWGIANENYFPDTYTSLLDEQDYLDVYGDTDIALTSILGAVKYNTDGVSFYVGGSYGRGFLRSTISGSIRTISIGKKKIFGGIILDGITKEPFVAPYAELGYWTADLDEGDETTGLSNAGESGFGFEYRAGLNFQLNWLDQASASDGLIQSGLQNTFVNVFISMQTKTDTNTDPDLSSDPALGVGLTLEF